MGLIREPLDVDFTVDSHVLTKEEKTAISEYIRVYKENEAQKNAKLNSKSGQKTILVKQ